MPSIEFYGMVFSPPCRAALFTAKVVGADINLIEQHPTKTRTPNFLAMNPAHCIPTIKDGDFTLWESRAIACYLAEKFGEPDTLVPTSPVERAKLNRMFYMEMSIWSKFSEYCIPAVFMGEKTDPQKLTKLHESLAPLDETMATRNYVIGNTVTVGDHSLVVSLTSMRSAGIDFSKYSNLVTYMERCKQLPCYEDAAETGLEEFGNFFSSKIAGGGE